MARLKSFPKLIHVTIEGDGDDQYYNVYEEGVFGMDVAGQAVAIYKLVTTGRVRIEKSFESSRKSKK